MNNEKIILYFGTKSRNGGHNITLLNGHFSIADQSKMADLLDSNELLYSKIIDGNGIRYLYYGGGTMLCVPVSLHDDRGGCKTMFIVEEYMSKEDILSELEKYPFYYDIFMRIKAKYKLEGIHEIKL